MTQRERSCLRWPDGQREHDLPGRLQRQREVANQSSLARDMSKGLCGARGSGVYGRFKDFHGRLRPIWRRRARPSDNLLDRPTRTWRLKTYEVCFQLDLDFGHRLVIKRFAHPSVARMPDPSYCDH